jgi:two-component system, cell cycle response regulator DivK
MKVVAVVEDNADNRLLIQALLGDLYELREYATGHHALVGFERSLPDVVLLDISLVGMDGVEVLERMRADPRMRHLPVIALTAHAMSGDRERYLAAGFDGYVAKPIYDEQVLLEAIERLLERPSQ